MCHPRIEMGSPATRASRSRATLPRVVPAHAEAVRLVPPSWSVVVVASLAVLAALLPVQAPPGRAPLVRLDPWTGSPGDEVAVYTSGFRAAAGIEVWFDDKRISQSLADSHGQARLTIRIPASSAGAQPVVARGATPLGPGTASTSFTVVPEGFATTAVDGDVTVSDVEELPPTSADSTAMGPGDRATPDAPESSAPGPSDADTVATAKSTTVPPPGAASAPPPAATPPPAIATPAPTPVPTVAATPAPAPPPANTFVDEFNGGALDRSTWGSHILPFPGTENTFEMGQVSVSDGALRITATRDGGGWRSGLIDTGGTFEQRYGYFEARCWFPEGNGLWPAWWLVRQPGTYQPEELDVVELLANPVSSGRHPHARIANATVHWQGGMAGYGFDAGVPLTGGWHVFAMEWRPTHVAFYLDGSEYWRYSGPNIPSVPMSPILNLAVGGEWAGPSDQSTPSTATMLVDYVRVRP